MKNWRVVILALGLLIFWTRSVPSQTNLWQLNNGKLIPKASFLGKYYFERIGYAIDGGGDVNGDGFDDFLIGTFHNSVIGSDAGAVYIFFGHARLPWALNCSVDSADACVLGQEAYDAAGYSIACNGDLNGDGIDDILIGAPAGNDRAPWLTGRVYILFGKSNPNWGSYHKLSEICDVVYEGESTMDVAGLSVAMVGDVNEDGYDDFLVGAPYRDEWAEDAGKVYFILGHPDPWTKSDQLTYSHTCFYYPVENAMIGYTVAGVGDINDDGTPDFAIGAFGRSRVFIIYGRKKLNWDQNFNLDNADLILYGNHPYTNEGFGWKITGNGDLNGDEISDLLISAIYDEDGGPQAGKVYILFGRNGGWNTQELALKNGDASFLGEQPSDHAGYGLAMTGDVDEDGYHDLLVGAYNSDNDYMGSKAYLIKGKASGWKQNTPLSTIPDTCGRSIDGIGYAVSSAGDVDNDGINDFLFAAPFNNEVQKFSGKVYLFASQQFSYRISGTVTYKTSTEPLPGAILQADTISTAVDTTDIMGNYQLNVRGKKDYTVHIQKKRGEHVGANISSYDAAVIARLAVHLDIPDTINIQAADINLDNRVNMYDAANTLRYAVQLPPLVDSYAGEWAFIPNSMYYDSILADHSRQDYVAYVRGDVDISWHYPGSDLAKINPIEDKVTYPVIQNGSEIILPINHNLNMPIISFDLELEYDPGKLEFLRIETTSLTTNWHLEHNNLDHKLFIGAFTLREIKKEGTILLVIFRVKDPSFQQTEIVINRFQINNHTLQPGSVNVTFDNPIPVPDEFQLRQNYPNPFNSFTTIPIYTAQKQHINVAIYDILGKQVTTLIDDTVKPGKYHITWDGKDEFGNQVASGVYICNSSLSSGNHKIKIIYMK